MNRKILAYCLLIIAVIPINYALTFSIKEIWIKHVMLQAFEHKALQVISINVSMVKWVEEDEVLMGDKYFDVKSFYISGTTIVLTGLYDDKEKALALQIEKFYNTENRNTEKMHVVVLFLQPVLLNESFSLQEKLVFKTSPSFAISSENIFNRQSSVDIPPPKMLC